MFYYIFSYIHKLLFASSSVILPNLWLGDINAAHDYEFIKKNNIDVIINCTKNIPFITEINKEAKDLQIEYYRLPVNDSLLEKDFILMQHCLDMILPEILEKYKEGKKILIHCYVGKQRSAIFVAALLKSMLDNGTKVENLEKIEDKKKEFDNIINFILSKRYHAFTFGYRVNFKKSYERYFKITE